MYSTDKFKKLTSDTRGGPEETNVPLG